MQVYLRFIKDQITILFSGEKVSSDAKKFIERLKTVRSELNKLDEEVKAECAKFRNDVLHKLFILTSL